MRAQHQIHRHVMASQPDDGVLGASTDEARLGDAGHAGDGTVRATLPAVHQLAQSFASKIAGVEHLVQAIMASLSLQPGAASDSGAGLHKPRAASALGGATGGLSGAARVASSSEQGVLLRRLRGVVRQLSRLRRGHISAGQARSGWPRSSLQQQPPPPAAAPYKRHGGTTGQAQQVARGDYERGQYAASHKASGAVAAPVSPVATATVADTVAQPHTGPDKVSVSRQPLDVKGGGGSTAKAEVAAVPPLRLVKHDIDAAPLPTSSRQEQRRRRDRARRLAPTSKLPPEDSKVLLSCSLAKHAYARSWACDLVGMQPCTLFPRL